MNKILFKSKTIKKMKTKLNLENLSQFIESESAIYIDKARSYGIELAKENKPKAFQDSLSPYISSIVAQFKSLWTKVETEIDEDIIKKDSEISMHSKETTHKQQEDALLEIRTKIKQVEDQIGRLADDYNWQLFIPLLLFSFALIFSESYFNSSFMQQVMRDISSLQAKALSFTIYALLFFVIQFFNNWIDNSTNDWEIHAKRFAKFLLFTVLFSFIAWMRTKYINYGDFDFLTFLGIFTVNLLFLITVNYLHQHFPSKNQINDYFRASTLKSRMAELQKKKKGIDSDLSSHSSSHIKLTKDTHQSLLILEKNKRLLKGKCEEAISAFIASNLSARPDRETPTCFNETLELNF